jgi:hypothetical protein
MAIYRERNFVHAPRGRGDITKVDGLSAFSERYCETWELSHDWTAVVLLA